MIWVEAGRWTLEQLLARVASHARRYVGAQVVVEAVAAQAWILQELSRGYGIGGARAFKTAGGKLSLHYQAERLAHALELGKLVIPSSGGLHPEIRQLVADLQRYSPADHIGDRLAALLIARSTWAMGQDRAIVSPVHLAR